MTDKKDPLEKFTSFEEVETETKAPVKKRDNSFELYTFLDRESNRLEKFVKLFKNKTYTIKHYSQAEALIDTAIDKNNDLKEEIIEYLSKENSPLNLKVTQMLQKHFLDSSN